MENLFFFFVFFFGSREEREVSFFVFLLRVEIERVTRTRTRARAGQERERAWNKACAHTHTHTNKHTERERERESTRLSVSSIRSSFLLLLPAERCESRPRSNFANNARARTHISDQQRATFEHSIRIREKRATRRIQEWQQKQRWNRYPRRHLARRSRLRRVLSPGRCRR